MEVHILDRNVGITSSQRDSVDRSLEFALDRFSSHIRTVEVAFCDVNGPKGGNDLQCRIMLALSGKGEIVVEGKGDSVEGVLAETADRAALAVSRRLDRLRDAQGTSMSGQ
jgi:putative sigma-54 modulation protein